MSDEAGRSPFLVDELPDALDSERIDRVVALLTGCSRSEAVEILNGGDVTLDGAVVTKASSRVASGDRIVIGRDPHRAPMVVEPDAAVEVDVVHADDDVIVVNKAPGLVVHPGSGTQGIDARPRAPGPLSGPGRRRGARTPGPGPPAGPRHVRA